MGHANRVGLLAHRLRAVPPTPALRRDLPLSYERDRLLLAACVGTPLALFFTSFWAVAGNRTLIESSTSSSVNRYTTIAILLTCAL